MHFFNEMMKQVLIRNALRRECKNIIDEIVAVWGDEKEEWKKEKDRIRFYYKRKMNEKDDEISRLQYENKHLLERIEFLEKQKEAGYVTLKSKLKRFPTIRHRFSRINI